MKTLVFITLGLAAVVVAHPGMRPPDQGFNYGTDVMYGPNGQRIVAPPRFGYGGVPPQFGFGGYGLDQFRPGQSFLGQINPGQFRPGQFNGYSG